MDHVADPCCAGPAWVRRPVEGLGGQRVRRSPGRPPSRRRPPGRRGHPPRVEVAGELLDHRACPAHDHRVDSSSAARVASAGSLMQVGQDVHQDRRRCSRPQRGRAHASRMDGARPRPARHRRRGRSPAAVSSRWAARSITSASRMGTSGLVAVDVQVHAQPTSRGLADEKRAGEAATVRMLLLACEQHRRSRAHIRGDVLARPSSAACPSTGYEARSSVREDVGWALDRVDVGLISLSWQPRMMRGTGAGRLPALAIIRFVGMAVRPHPRRTAR